MRSQRLAQGVRRYGFEERRETALVRLLIDTGMRVAEVVSLRLADLDLDLGVAVVVGKGRALRASATRKSAMMSAGTPRLKSRTVTRLLRCSVITR